MLLFSRKLKLSIYTSFWQVFWTVLFAKYWAVSLSHCFYVNVAARSGVKRFANRERLTLNNTNFPLINMQQLKHIFQNLLNELVHRESMHKWLNAVCKYDTTANKLSSFKCWAGRNIFFRTTYPYRNRIVASWWETSFIIDRRLYS